MEGLMWAGATIVLWLGSRHYSNHAAFWLGHAAGENYERYGENWLDQGRTLEPDDSLKPWHFLVGFAPGAGALGCAVMAGVAA